MITSKLTFPKLDAEIALEADEYACFRSVGSTARPRSPSGRLNAAPNKTGHQP